MAQEITDKPEMKIIGKGAHSIVYIDPTNPNIIIKQNNSVSGDRGYLKRQQAGYEIIERIKKSGYATGVQLPTVIETNEQDEVQTIKEQRINGRTFDDDGKLWDSLTEEQKSKVAKQMATFLVAMHSTGDIKPAEKSIKTMFDKSKLHNSATDIINAYEGAMPQRLANKLLDAEQYLESTDVSDEFHVLTHKDLRVNNLMFDQETGQLSVLDFEMAGTDNIYRDFVAYASSSSMPWDYTRRVIAEYNAIQPRKYPLKINPEKVQNMLLYAIAHECSRNVTHEQNEQIPDEEKQKFFQDLITRINRLTGFDIATDNIKVFKKGINQLTQQGNTQISPAKNNDDITEKSRRKQ